MLFIFIAEQYSIVWIDQFIHSTTEANLVASSFWRLWIILCDHNLFNFYKHTREKNIAPILQMWKPRHKDTGADPKIPMI